MMDNPFIVRVYGILMDSEKGLLVSDEFYQGKYFTKFPGGGLEYGEGTIDCLRRELLEEVGIEFEISHHFYTTDFFVESAFHSGKQVMSIYYFIFTKKISEIKISENPFDFDVNSGGMQSFRFIPVRKISGDIFTFPVDRHVALLLNERQ